MSSTSDDEKAVMDVITAETNAFWMKDYAAWANCWLQTPDIRMAGWWARGGIRVTEGWEALSRDVQRLMENNPLPQPRAAQVRREKINLRISDQMAWVTFDQYGADTGEPEMDMPGLSHETRILEKREDEWKIVYVCWLLDNSIGG